MQIFFKTPFSLPMIYIAVFGQDAASRGNDIRARLSQKISFGVSLAGIVIGLITIVVLGSMFGHYAANWISCPHGYYHHNGQRVCCGSVTCTHGVHIDSDTGCIQCCDPYSKLDCFKYGYVNDSQGCKVCYSVIKESCTNGFHKDNFGCPKCCEPAGYNSASNYYNDSNGCRKACIYSEHYCTAYGYRLDERGCRECCMANENKENGCNCSNIICDQGYANSSAGCKVCCANAINRDLCTQGFYINKYGCPACCNNFHDWSCSTYGRYIDSNGCTQCCNSFTQSDCYTHGYYLDTRGCKVCCNPRLMNTGGGCNCTNLRCDNGFRNDTTDCKACCPQSKNYCNSYNDNSGYYYDSSGCPKCCERVNYCSSSYYNDTNGCKKCCASGQQWTNGYFKDSYGCNVGCDSSKNDTGCNCSNIQCVSGYHTNISMGCKVCCQSVSLGSCQSGIYYDSLGCPKCCEVVRSCPYGYFVDSRGCKKCCPQIYPGSHLTSNADPDTSNIIRDCNCSNVQCLQGRVANQTCDGRAICCDYSDSMTCKLYGFHYDFNGCKKCCSTPPYVSSFCHAGFYFKGGNCLTCCRVDSDPIDTCSVL